MAKLRGSCDLLSDEWVSLGIVTCVAAYLIWLGQHTGWTPFSVSCGTDPACYPAPGETVTSIVTAQHYLKDGTRHWFIQDLRLPSHTTDPPLFYTHNVNIGAFVYYVFGLMGLVVHLQDLPAPTIASMAVAVTNIVVFCAGLHYGFLFVRKASASSVFSFLFLLLMASEYFFNLAFGLNAIRNWHWVALFGSAYHLLRVLESPTESGKRHVVAYWLWSGVAFAIGYDFLVIHLCLSLLLVVSFSSRRSRLSRGGILLAAYLLPFGLRQVQIIGGLGIDFWAKDLYYTAVIKTAFLNKVLPLPGIAELDRWYAAHNVFRPVAFPEKNLFNIFPTFVKFFSQNWITRLGWLGVLIPGLAGLCAVGVTVFSTRGRDGSGDLEKASAWREFVDGLGDPAKTVVIVGAAQLLGLLFFAPLSIHFYIKHMWPMVISFILLAYAFGVYALVSATRLVGDKKSGPNRRGLRAVLLGAAVVLLGERLVRQVINYREVPLIAPSAVQAMSAEADVEQFYLKPLGKWPRL